MEAPRVVADQTHVQSPVAKRWVAIVAAVLVGVIGWSLFASLGGSDEPAAAEGSEETADASSGVTEEPTDTTSRSTTSSPNDRPGQGDREEGVEAAEVVEEAERLGDGGPLLGEEVGYELIVSGRPLKRLDLDTGALTELDVSVNNPIAAAGRTVLVRGNNGGMHALNLDTGEPIQLQVEADHLSFVAVEDDGSAWFHASTVGIGRFVRLDVASGAQLEERDANVADFGPIALAGLSLGLATSPAGGVYEQDGEQYRLVAPGQLLAASSDAVLVRQCDDTLQCSLQWLSREDFGPVDLLVPEGEVPYATMVQGTDWLRVVALPNWTEELFNIRTGQIVDLSDEGWEAGPPISPDGEWLVRSGTPGMLTVERLATGELIEIEGLPVWGGQSIVWAATSAS